MSEIDVLDQSAPTPLAPIGETKLDGFGGRKVFTKSFRLVFRRVEDQATTWIEVESLYGLKNVISRIGDGELVPINPVATLDRQLWGLLAEHVGFLRYEGPTGYMHDGVQPVGAETAALADDLSALFGGVSDGFTALGEMRDSVVDAQKSVEAVYRHKNEYGNYLKEDGVNLTPKGEKELAGIVYDSFDSANLEIKMDTANAEVLVSETDTEDSPIGDAVAEIDAQARELKTTTGVEAADEGRKVQKAAEGDLEDNEEID